MLKESNFLVKLTWNKIQQVEDLLGLLNLNYFFFPFLITTLRLAQHIKTNKQKKSITEITGILLQKLQEYC